MTGDALEGRRVPEVAREIGQAPGEAPEHRLVHRLAVASIALRARWRSSSSVQSLTATPTTGQVSSPRRSSRYSERKVITLARSPLIPNTTSTSAGCCSSVRR